MISKNIHKPLTVSVWVRYMSAGWLLGVLLVLLLSGLLENTGIAGQSSVGIGMGAGIGIMQWQALKKHFAPDKKWIWLMLTGISVPFIMLDVLSLVIVLVPEYIIPVAATVGGFLAGWLQYRFILRKDSGQGKSWIVYFGIGWSVACLMTMVFFFVVPELNIDKSITVPLAFIFVLIGGPLLGLFTGRRIVSISKNREMG